MSGTVNLVTSLWLRISQTLWEIYCYGFAHYNVANCFLNIYVYTNSLVLFSGFVREASYATGNKVLTVHSTENSDSRAFPNTTFTSPSPRHRKHHRRQSRKKLEGGEISCKKMSSTHDMTIVLVNSLHLCLPAQDPYAIRPSMSLHLFLPAQNPYAIRPSMFCLDRAGVHEAQGFPMRPLAVNDSWEKAVIFFSGTAPVNSLLLMFIQADLIKLSWSHAQKHKSSRGW